MHRQGHDGDSGLYEAESRMTHEDEWRRVAWERGLVACEEVAWERGKAIW